MEYDFDDARRIAEQSERAADLQRSASVTCGGPWRRLQRLSKPSAAARKAVEFLPPPAGDESQGRRAEQGRTPPASGILTSGSQPVCDPDDPSGRPARRAAHA